MTAQGTAATSRRLDVAYCYPAPYWHMAEGAWVKSLLLFFDKVSILLPGYMYGLHHAADPVLAGPLEDRGLLEVLEPTQWIDHEMATTLAEVVTGLVADGVFDDLPRNVHFHELSRSRMGYGVDVDLGESLVAELQTKGLAKPSEDGVSVPLQPTVRTTILVILAQLARAAGSNQDLSVHPATNDKSAIQDLLDTLSRERMPSRSRVIALDLEPVGFDLDSVPLDDVLEFRAEHRDAYRAYMRDLRGFMAELADVDIPEEREALLLERRQELADAAHDLQRSTRRALGKSLPSWFVGIAGTAWSAAAGDPIGTVLGAAGLVVPGVLGAKVGNSNKVTAYSYLFQVERAFRH